MIGVRRRKGNVMSTTVESQSWRRTWSLCARTSIAVWLLALVGCGASAGTWVSGIATVMDAVKGAVEQRTGKSIDDLPVSCEHEYDPEAEKVLVLCEVDLAN
jgi:hypothetical protein